MKNILQLAAILLFFTGCNSTEDINTTIRYEATKGIHSVEMTGDDNTKLVSFEDISDIGKGTLTLPEGHTWPKNIILRLPFSRLEGFKAYSNLDKKHKFEHFHSAGSNANQYIATYKDSEKKSLARDDEAFVEIELPHEMWQDNPKVIYLEWVNVYRN